MTRKIKGQIDNARTFWDKQSTNAKYLIVLGAVIGGLAMANVVSEAVQHADRETTVASSYSSGYSAEESYAPPPRATDPEFADDSGAGHDTARGFTLANEAATLLLDIDLISRNSTNPCVDIADIRAKINRVWRILAELDSMDIGSAMEAKMDEAVASVTQVEKDTLLAEKLCS